MKLISCVWSSSIRRLSPATKRGFRYVNCNAVSMSSPWLQCIVASPHALLCRSASTYSPPNLHRRSSNERSKLAIKVVPKSASSNHNNALNTKQTSKVGIDQFPPLVRTEGAISKGRDVQKGSESKQILADSLCRLMEQRDADEKSREEFVAILKQWNESREEMTAAEILRIVSIAVDWSERGGENVAPLMWQMSRAMQAARLKGERFSPADIVAIIKAAAEMRRRGSSDDLVSASNAILSECAELLSLLSSSASASSSALSSIEIVDITNIANILCLAPAARSIPYSEANLNCWRVIASLADIVLATAHSAADRRLSPDDVFELYYLTYPIQQVASLRPIAYTIRERVLEELTYCNESLSANALSKVLVSLSFQQQNDSNSDSNRNRNASTAALLSLATLKLRECRDAFDNESIFRALQGTLSLLSRNSNCVFVQQQLTQEIHIMRLASECLSELLLRLSDSSESSFEEGFSVRQLGLLLEMISSTDRFEDSKELRYLFNVIISSVSNILSQSHDDNLDNDSLVVLLVALKSVKTTEVQFGESIRELIGLIRTLYPQIDTAVAAAVAPKSEDRVIETNLQKDTGSIPVNIVDPVAIPMSTVDVLDMLAPLPISSSVAMLSADADTTVSVTETVENRRKSSRSSSRSARAKASRNTENGQGEAINERQRSIIQVMNKLRGSKLNAKELIELFNLIEEQNYLDNTTRRLIQFTGSKLEYYRGTFSAEDIAHMLHCLRDCGSEGDEIEQLLGHLRLYVCANVKEVPQIELLVKSFTGLRSMSSDHPFVRAMVNSLSSQLQAINNQRISRNSVSLILHSMRFMSSDHMETTRLLRVVASLFDRGLIDTTEQWNFQQLANALNGLQNMSNSDESVQLVLHRLAVDMKDYCDNTLPTALTAATSSATKDSTSELLSLVPICIYGLKSFNSQSEDVQTIIRCVGSILKQRTTQQLSTEELFKCVYGLRSMDNSHIEVQNILAQLTDQLKEA